MIQSTRGTFELALSWVREFARISNAQLKVFGVGSPDLIT